MTPDRKRSWRDALGIYSHPRVAAMLFLGFSAGLPFALTAGTLTAWLTREGVSMSNVGMFAWVGVLYALKFVWSPLIDQIRVPFLTAALGRRRSWMLLAQVGVAASLLAMAGTSPADQLAAMAWFAVLVAFFSATQDIAVDAWRIEARGSGYAGCNGGCLSAGLSDSAVGGGCRSTVGWRHGVLRGGLPTDGVNDGIGMITVLIVAEPEVEAGVEQLSIVQTRGDGLTKRLSSFR